MVERKTLNLVVVGSIPTEGAFLPMGYTFNWVAALAQLGERQTEDLKVPGSIPGFDIIQFILIELKIIIWLSKPFFNPKIDFKTSLACSDPKIPATGEKIPSVSQFFSKTGLSGIKHL